MCHTQRKTSKIKRGYTCNTRTKVGKTCFSLGFVIILEGLHSLVAFKMEIEPARIDEELNASTMDFPQMTKDGIL